jgi:hypothetical protein
VSRRFNRKHWHRIFLAPLCLAGLSVLSAPSTLAQSVDSSASKSADLGKAQPGSCQDDNGALALLDGQKVKVLLERPKPLVRVSEAFNLIAHICPKEEGASITRATLDATMPEHQHGMNYKPKLQLSGGVGQEILGARQLSAQGMVFHMPGKWQIELQVFGRGRDNLPWATPERLRFDYLLN